MCIRDRFRIKMKALLEDLLKNDVLGKVIAWTYVVEFQKRGLPHIHILLIMRGEDKPRTPEDIDARICADFPDPSDPAQSELLPIISTSQVHGPCGVRNPQCVCMAGGACTKGYPKEFAETTQLNEDGLV